MNRMLLWGAAGSVLLFQSLAVAGVDSCDDYFQRHYKADLMQVGASVTNVPRHGDIAGYQSLDIEIQNVGNQPITGPTLGGLFAANPLRVGWRRNPAHPSLPLPLQQIQSSIPAPVPPGAKRTVSVSLPEGTLSNCEPIVVAIDTAQSAGQHGCRVFANDVSNYRIHVRGMPRCHLVTEIRPGGGSDAVLSDEQAD